MLHLGVAVVVGTSSSAPRACGDCVTSRPPAVREQEVLVETAGDVGEEPPVAAVPAVGVAASSPATERGGASKRGRARPASTARPADNARHASDIAAIGSDMDGASSGADGAGERGLGGDRAVGAPGTRGLPRVTPHGPILVASAAGCDRYFPFSARAREALVTLAVDVSPSGQTDEARIVDERPAREGFGAAARSCAMRSLRFSPAIDRRGDRVPATSTLQLRFTRPDPHG